VKLAKYLITITYTLKIYQVMLLIGAAFEEGVTQEVVSQQQAIDFEEVQKFIIKKKTLC
jgi:hypothetical protein